MPVSIRSVHRYYYPQSQWFPAFGYPNLTAIGASYYVAATYRLLEEQWFPSLAVHRCRPCWRVYPG